MSPDGSTVFVTGFGNGGFTTGSEYATVACDAPTGAKLWVKPYNGVKGTPPTSPRPLG